MTHKENSREDFNALLVSEQVLGLESLDVFLKEQKKTKQPLLEILIRSGKIDEKKLLGVFTRHFGYPSVNPSVFVIAPELITLIPQKLAEKFLALPISLHEKKLTIAFANPMNVQAIDELMAVTGKGIRAVAAEPGMLKQAIRKCYGVPAAPGSQVAAVIHDPEQGLDELVKMIEIERGRDTEGPDSDLLKIAYETPVIKLVNMILLEGIRRHA